MADTARIELDVCLKDENVAPVGYSQQLLQSVEFCQDATTGDYTAVVTLHRPGCAFQNTIKRVEPPL